MISALLVVLLITWKVEGFYFPGVSPKDYEIGSKIQISVNAITSSRTMIAYDYYYPLFHFCRPSQGIVPIPESLGSVMMGDRLYESNWEISMLEEHNCEFICNTTIPANSVGFLGQRIHENYQYNWVIDGLPAMTPYLTLNEEKVFSVGVPIGYVDSEMPILNNHFDVMIHYHSPSPNIYRIIRVEMIPFSMNRVHKESLCLDPDPFVLNGTKSLQVDFTYSVKFMVSDTPWSTRWDSYASDSGNEAHVYSVINSMVVMLLLSLLVAMVTLKALKRDIHRYNSIDSEENDDRNDYGWKLVHGDVFRPPKFPLLFSVLIGNGMQIICIGFISLVFSGLGFASPALRGILTNTVFCLFILLSSVSGYTSIRIYKMFKGTNIKKCLLLTAFGLSGFIFTMILILNFVLIFKESSNAIPFGTLFALFTLWMLVSVPLCFLGGLFAYRQSALEFPCKTNLISREIPLQPFFLREIVTIPIAGIFPYGSAFIELYLILNSYWFNEIYFMFGFSMIAFLIVMITSGQTAILITYLQLCYEDYEWSWRSFRTMSSSGFYIFLLGCSYGLDRLISDSLTSIIIYVGWMFLLSCLFSLVTGTIGYISSLIFIGKIFSSIKVD